MRWEGNGDSIPLRYINWLLGGSEQPRGRHFQGQSRRLSAPIKAMLFTEPVFEYRNRWISDTDSRESVVGVAEYLCRVVYVYV